MPRQFSGSRTLLCSVAAGAIYAATLGGAQAQQQATSVTPLDPIVVEGEAVQDANSADGATIVAKRARGASKTNTSLVETPQAVSVVTRQQMEAQDAETVAQALRYTPGVSAEPNGYDIRYDWLNIRGFETYGTLWLDGLVMPGDPLNYATPTIHPFALDRIEVVKGPASVLYGRTIPGGLVNLVSKRPQETARREASVRTTAFGGIEGSIDATGPLTVDGDWLYRVTALAKNMDTQIDMERDRKLLIAPSLTWNPSDDTSLTLYGYYQRDRDIFSPRFYPAYGTLLPNPDGQIPRDLFLADPNADEFNRDYFHLGYEFAHSFNETWTVRQNLRYGRADQDMNLALVNPAFAFGWGVPPNSELQRVSAISDDSVSAFTVDNQAEARFQTGEFDHTVLMGLDYVRATSDTNFGNSAQDVFVPPLDYNNPIYGLPIPRASITRSGLQKQNQLGVYVQDQIRYDNWLGTFGLRYDHSDIDTTNRMPLAGDPSFVSTTDSQLTWRAGLTYLFDNGFAPYVSYSTAFLPTMGSDSSGNPFKAQTAEQFEVGVKYEPLDGQGMVGVSFFNLTQENSLTPDPNDIWYSVQGGKQRVRGIELEGKYELTPELTVMGAYAYSDSEVLASTAPLAVGKEMLELPEHQASLWAIYRPDFAPGLGLSAGVRAISSYQTDATYLPELRIPSRALVDVGLEYDFGADGGEFAGTTLRANVTNLFDKTYVTHCLNATGGSCNYGAGRAISASLSYSW